MQGDDLQRAAGVREGDVLAGKYRVERVLGIGGMGVVVAARHLQLDTRVAIKFLLPSIPEDHDAVTRFAREARAAVKITSEHVARVFDVGRLETGAPYMVMEYLEGGDLAAWIKQRGALSIEQAIEFVLQACVAVADAHALGIVHRDLKPANLFCVRRSDGQLSVKVLDFGISKMVDTSGLAPGSMTRTSALMGSPLYMSPEQMRSAKDVDAQTDIWALGVILFELISGGPPFQAESVTELAIRVNNEPTPAIRSLRPEVPGELEAIIARCLEKDRTRRYRNVAELALALMPFGPKRAKASVERISGIIQGAGFLTTGSTIPPSDPMTSTQFAPSTVAPVGRTAGGSTGRKTARRAAMVGAVALVAVAGSVGLLKRSPQRGEDPQAAAVQAPGPLKPSADSPPSAPSEAQPARSPIADPSVTAAASSAPAVMPPAAAVARPAAPPSRPAGVAGGAGVTGVAGHPTLVGLPFAAGPAPASRPDCTPPYVIDSAGDRQYKPECL